MHKRFARTHVTRITRVSLILAAVATGVFFSGSAQAMQMSAGSPEHVADALTALTAGNLTAAKADLAKAIATSAEPKMARMHASEALVSLKAHKLAAARDHAENGAAVEHFTYALRALNQGTMMNAAATARAHLKEALALPAYKKYATAALAALAKNDPKTAKANTSHGLNAAVMAP